MTTLIIGAGEIGTAIGSIFKQYQPYFLDQEKGLEPISKEYDVIHICFGWSNNFVDNVRDYQKRFKPKYTIIHSTVKPGTCRELNAIHSPVIGRHPFLEESIRTFTKMIAGEQASEVADYFLRTGLKIQLFDQPEITEICKLRDTELYGLLIEYTKDIKRDLQARNLPFEAWILYNEIYNKGYKDMKMPHYARPTLQPVMKKIGGHCVRPNYELHKTKFTDLLKELNDFNN